MTLTIQGTERTYSLLVPDSYDPATPAPLVLAFHGYTMSPTQMVRGSWGGLANEFGFLLAAPAGLDAQWAVAHNDAEAAAALPNSKVPLAEFPIGDRDVAFAAAVLADVSEYLYVDPARIFATGESLGGFMASRVACDIGEHFAGLGPTFNSLLYTAPCDTEQQLAVVSVGTSWDSTHAVVDAESAAAGWADHNGCQPGRSASEPEEHIARYSYDGCSPNAPVALYVHDYSWPADSDERVVWEFFASLP